MFKNGCNSLGAYQFQKKSVSATAILSFIIFIQPIIGILLSLLLRRNTVIGPLIFLFCLNFGYTFAKGPYSADCNRYAEDLHRYYVEAFNVGDIFKNSDDHVNLLDLYQPLLTFIVSRYTNNEQILFLCFSVVYGLFFSANLSEILRSKKLSINKIDLIAVILYFSQSSLHEGINGVRFYTAAQILLFGIRKICLVGIQRNIGWIFLLLSPMVHWSAVVVLMSLCLSFMVGKWPKILLIITLLSILLKQVGGTDQFSRAYLSLNFDGGAAIVKRVDDYNKFDEYNSLVIDNTLSWKGRIALFSLDIILIVYSFIIISKENLCGDRIAQRRLMVVALILISISNFFPNGHTAERFAVIGRFIWLFGFNSNWLSMLSAKEHNGFIVALPAAVVIFVYEIREMLDFTGIHLFGLVPTIFTSENQTAIISLIK